ncbi:sodium/glucose cotransporter 4-like [Glandiceps talaboti]
MASGEDLVAVDYVIIALYFAIVLGVGLWASLKANRGTTTGYFLAGRGMQWWPVGLSLYVTNIGSSSFIGIAGSAAVDGIAVVFYEFSGLVCLLLMGFMFVPIYISSGSFTMPDYLHRRFGGERLRVYMATTGILLAILTALAAEMYSGAIIIQQAVGWDLYVSCISLLALTAIYTVLGGLTAVIYTDAVQSFIIIGSATILTILAFLEIGKYEDFKNLYMDAVPNTTVEGNTTCGIPSPEAWHLFRPVDSSLPWPGVIFGINILSAYYFCTNQVIVQRCLAAKNITHAKAGSVLAAYLKILPMFLMVWPGMISRILYTDEVGCVEPDSCLEQCGNAAGCSNLAYPILMMRIMPIGLRGLMMAAMLAAIMSSLTSIFNSTSSILTIDLWARCRPKAGQIELMIVGKVVVLVLVGFSILWLPVIEAFGNGQLFVYIQSIASYFNPPVIAAYLMAIFWERMTEQGAFWGLMIGLVVGMTRMALDFAFQAPPCGEPDDRPLLLSTFHYLYFAIFLFGFSIIVMVIISLLTKPVPEKKLARLTWWRRNWEKEPEDTEELKEEDNTTFEMEETKKQAPDDDEKSAAVYSEITEDENQNVDNVVVEDEEEVDGRSKFRRGFDWICGFDQSKQKLSKKEMAEIEKQMCSLDEDPFWARVVNINGVVAMVIGLFCWGFFG